jgi:hypothetical protein
LGTGSFSSSKAELATRQARHPAGCWSQASSSAALRESQRLEDRLSGRDFDPEPWP